MRSILAAAAGLALAISATSANAYTFDKNVPEPVRKQIIDDLAFMSTIAGTQATPLHQKIFGSLDGAGYVTFFESRVTSVGMNSCGGGNAVACVIPFLGSSRIWLTQNYVKFSHPTIAKMMVVYHEARHTERQNGNWSHATCPRPFKDADGSDMKSIWTGASLAGEPACDATPLGSYGSSVVLLKNIQKNCESCSEKVKMDAGIYADDQFKRITNESAKQEMLKDLYSAL